MYQIHLQTLIKNKFEFLYQKDQHPTWWDNIPYWEFEEYIKLLNERNKEEADQKKKQEEQQQAKSPNMGSFKPGNFKPPDYSKYMKR